MQTTKPRQSGQALVELLVALSLTAIMLPALFAGFTSSREGRVQQQERFRATTRVREAKEAIRVIRESGWASVATNGTYHPVLSGTTWALSQGEEAVDGQTRSIVIADTYRDTNGAIASTGNIDPSTKTITITVSWNTPFPSMVTSTLYVTRYNNQIFTQTTESEFTLGVHTGTTVTNTDGGEVTLGAGGQASWCDPNLTISALDLPKNGVANGITAIEGRVFAGTGDNASGVSFANVTISNANPPTASVSGTFNSYKTNAVFGETDYAYIATDTNDQEITIFDLTSVPYPVIGTFDSPGPTDGSSIFVMGAVGYMAAGNTMYTFDLTSRMGERGQLDSVGLAGEGKKIFVVGNYAFVATDATSLQLQIIDVSDPTNISIVGSASLAGQGGVDVFVNQAATRAYVATSTSATQRELFIVDVSIKTGSRPTIGSYESNGMNPKGVTVVPGNRAILVGVGAEEYQAINIVNEYAPLRCGGLQINTGINGVSSVLESDGDAYSYIITGDATTELKIIEGGPGGQFSLTGSFESDTFRAQAAGTAFNRFSTNVTIPTDTIIEYQVAVADAINGLCDGVVYTFVGPDGTTATKFTAEDALPLSDDGLGYENPGQCMRYRVYLSTNDSSYAPVFEDITVNFSP